MLMPGKKVIRNRQYGRMSGKAWRGSDVTSFRAITGSIAPSRRADRLPDRGGARGDDAVHRRAADNLDAALFPDKPITKKPQETRMGKGKGAPDQWVAVVKPGRVMFEMEGVTEKEAREAMRLAAAKLPMRTKFATRFAQEKML